MPTRPLQIFSLVLLAPCMATAQPPAGSAKPSSTAVTYQDHVLPLLRKHCLNCHNPDKATSDLNITTYQALMTGGASGEAVKPGSPDQSLLYRLMAHQDEPKMPPKGPRVSDAELSLIKQWIERGAPETAVGAARTATRKLDIDPVTITAGRPDGPPPMPTSLPTVSLSRTSRPHPVTAMATSPWAPLLAVAGHERILLYHTETLKLIGVLPFPERIPYVLKFSRNGKWLLAAGGRGAFAGKVVLWDVSTGKRLAEIGDEADTVLAADISPDHKLVALGGPGKLVKVFDTASGQLRYQVKKHTDWVTMMEFSPDGTMLATGDRNGGAYVWDAATGGIVFTLGDHKEAITGLNWRADGQMLASSSEDGRVILWYAEDGFPTRSFNAQAGKLPNGSTPRQPSGVLAVQYTREGQLVTCGRDSTARILKPDGSQIARLEGFKDLPSRVAISSDGSRVFVGDFTGTIRVWDMKDKKPVGVLSTNPE